MMHFTVSVLDAGVAKGLRKIREKMDYPFPLYRKIGLLYVDNAKMRFKSHTDPKGRNWKHNTTATRFLKKVGLKKRKPAIRGEYAIGTWTGNLAESIWFNIRGNEISVGVMSNEPSSRYASTFQFGAKRGEFSETAPWNTIPPRQFLGFNKVTNNKAIDLIKNHFTENK